MSRIAAAKVTGREHRGREANAQDAFVAVESPVGFVLAVSDGCGSTRAAEVGAALSVQIAAGFALERLSRGGTAAEVAARAGDAVAERLGRIAGCVPRMARAAFIEDHLFATLLLTVATRDDVAIAAFGDGVVWVDERAVLIDQSGAPRYLGHALVGDRGATEPCFRWSRARRDVSRVAIASDGLGPEMLGRAFGRPGRGLARWLNVMRDKHPLLDDTTVALAEEVDQ